MTENDKNKNVEEVVRRYVNWLDSEIGIQWAYHNHKETMAWSATAGYLSILVLTNAVAPILTNLFAKLVFCALLLALAYATYLFVNMQFEMRWKAADTSRGLRRAKTKICNITTDEEINDLDTVFDKKLEAKRTTEPWMKAVQYPKFITDEIEEANTDRQDGHQIRQILFPSLYETLCKASFIWPSTLKKINARTWSELASYSILAVVTVIAMLAALLAPLEGAAV